MRSWRNLSLLTQLAVPLIVVIALVATTFTYFAIRQEVELLSEKLESEALSTLALVISASSSPLIESDTARLVNIITQETGNWENGRIFAANGRLLIDSAQGSPSFVLEPDPEGLRLLTLTDVRIDNQADKLIVADSVRVGNQILGAVILEFSKDEILAQQNSLILQVLIVSTIVVIMMSVFILILGRGFTNSARVLIKATEEIGHGNLAYRTVLPGTLELNNIAISVNEMATRMEEATAALNKRTEELVKAEKERVLSEEASQAKSDFLAKVNHELRTPLGGILGNVELLYSGVYGEVTDKQKDKLLQVINSAGYLKSLINELLDQAELESGNFHFQPSPFEVTDFIDAVISQVEVLALRKELSLKSEIDPNMPPLIVADAKRLQQIAINLINNAIKFTREGEILFAVKMADDHSLLLQVTDGGVGISEEDQKHLFTPFKQVGRVQTRHNEGFGLGLAIVKQLVEMMGGTIELKSKKGTGTTFLVRLPVNIPEKVLE